MKKPALVVTFAVLFGCVETISVPVASVRPDSGLVSASKAYISDKMRDPDSAKFRNIVSYRISNGDVIICGEVNGTNGFGDIQDFRIFI